MSILLPSEFNQNAAYTHNLGTQSMQMDNAQRTAIMANEPASQSKQNENKEHNGHTFAKDTFDKVTQDKVSLSTSGKEKSQKLSNEQTQLSDEEQQEVQALKERDAEVKVHEQAHAAVGGQYAGSPQYEYETGPDGKRYAVGGEVSIDVSEEEAPEDTVQKMQIVRAAALAPAEPSAQDLKVAAEASQKETTARAEMGQNQLEAKTPEKANNTNPGVITEQQTKLARSYAIASTTEASSLSIFA